MSQFEFVLLGDAAISKDGVAITRFRSEKARALLFYLALEKDRAHTREHLCGMFWGGLGEGDARHNLSQAIFYLQNALGKESLRHILAISRNSLQFQGNAETRVDAHEFLDLLEACRVHPHRHIETCPVCLGRLVQAAALYRGELLAHVFLDDCPGFEEWLVVRREHFQRLALDALKHVTAYHQAQGVSHHDDTIRFARRQIELEPWREEPYRVLMQILAATNQADAALAAYQSLARVLNDELGLEPSPETMALFKHLRDVTHTRQTGTGHTFSAAAAPAPQTDTFVPPLSNLPLSTTLLIGRTRELAELSEKLTDTGCRLLTLVGQGGIGKTRLAIQTARDNTSAFPHGTYFVDLTDIVSEEGIPNAIAGAMQFTFRGNDSPTRQILRHLADFQQPVLLVLDNLEQVVNGAQMVHEIAQRAPYVTMLATSRERLNLGEEWLYEVEGLETPSVLPAQPGPEWNASAAVQLLAQCALRAHIKTEKWSSDEKRAAIRIAQMVEGMPLAIELASGWLRTLTPTEIAVEIERSLDALEGTRRDMPRRHAGIRAVFEHSWLLLNPDEQHVFARLAVFHGGMTRDAAVEIADASLATLSALVDKSLVKRAGSGRFRLHELVRQYAAEKLAQQDAAAMVQAEIRHSRYFLQLFESSGSQLVMSGGGTALQELRREADNVRQAWRAACLRHDTHALDSVLNSLTLFYLTATLYQDGVDQLGFALAQLGVNRETHARDVQAPALASRMLAEQARLETQLTQHDKAIQDAGQAIALGEAAGDSQGIAAGYLYRGYAMRRQGEYARARELLARAVELARAAGHAQLEWEARMYLGGTFWNESAYGPARMHWDAALALCRGLGNLRGESLLLNNLAIIAHEQGMFEAARGYWKECERISKSVGTDWLWGSVSVNLGLLEIDQGEFEAAWNHLNQAQYFFKDIHAPWQAHLTDLGLGQLALAMGDYALARDQLQVAAQGLGAVPAPTDHARALALLGLAYHFLNECDLARDAAARGVSIAREIGDQFTLGKALLILGCIHAGKEQVDAAQTAYAQALAIFESLGLVYLQVEARAGLARALLDRGEREAVREQLEPVAQFLGEHPADGMDVPLQVYLVCYQGLYLFEDARADTLLQNAHAFLMKRASSIQDNRARRRYLEGVPANAELMRLVHRDEKRVSS